MTFNDFFWSFHTSLSCVFSMMALLVIGFMVGKAVGAKIISEKLLQTHYDNDIKKVEKKIQKIEGGISKMGVRLFIN